MIAVLAAPSNLGLRPPEPGSVPGAAKAPEALREAGLHAQLLELGAVDVGVVVAGRYRDDHVPGTERLRNQEALLDHARRLSDRVTGLLDARAHPLVLGGDCSLLLGVGLALRRRGAFGLVHIDGHTDFRNPGNSDACASLAGEDLAAVVGRHWPTVSDVDALGPYVDPAAAVHLGCRPDDEDLDEVRGALAACLTVADLRRAGVGATADRILAVVGAAHLDGYWLHLDVDVLDPGIMPAVDDPAPGGLTTAELTDLLAALAPGAAGADVTVFDPDLDPDGRHALLLSAVVAAGLGGLGRGEVAGPGTVGGPA